jgi:hypothetical protein
MEHGPSLLCMPIPVTVPLPLRRRSPQVHLSSILPGDTAFAATLPARHLALHLNRVRVVRLRRCSNSLMLRPGHLLAPPRGPSFRWQGHRHPSLHAGGCPTRMSGQLPWSQTFPQVVPSSTRLTWLQAAQRSGRVSRTTLSDRLLRPASSQPLRAAFTGRKKERHCRLSGMSSACYASRRIRTALRLQWHVSEVKTLRSHPCPLQAVHRYYVLLHPGEPPPPPISLELS